jgi:hypothetical protein
LKKAIKSAQQYKFINNLAIAYEKTANLWLAEGKPHYALYNIKQAIISFTQWGALPK